MSEHEKTSLADWVAWVLASIMGVIGGVVVGWILGGIIGVVIAWPLGDGVSILSMVIGGIGAIVGAIVGLRSVSILYPKSKL